MLSKEEFVRFSLEINLFFQRIMKEHLFFLETNLQPVQSDYIQEARTLKQSFEGLLAETTHYANGVVSLDAIESNEFVTPYTLKAEKLNMALTGAELNTEITAAELQLTSNPEYSYINWVDIASSLNDRSLALLDDVIAFQNKLLSMTSKCEIFISLYHEMLEHDTREAEYYREILKALKEGKHLRTTLCKELNFWNNIMGEHAQFIDGMLDPTEKTLKGTAEDFANKFEMLVEKCIRTAEKQILKDSLEATEKIRDFKRDSTIGLLECNIKSIIPPLLADHVLREANHYLRLFKVYNI